MSLIPEIGYVVIGGWVGSLLLALYLSLIQGKYLTPI